MIKYFLTILSIISLCLITQCEKSKSEFEIIDPGNPFYGKIEQSYFINSNLTFSIDSIIDYRCPGSPNTHETASPPTLR